jgi:hypothetical protein
VTVSLTENSFEWSLKKLKEINSLFRHSAYPLVDSSSLSLYTFYFLASSFSENELYDEYFVCILYVFLMCVNPVLGHKRLRRIRKIRNM